MKQSIYCLVLSLIVVLGQAESVQAQGSAGDYRLSSSYSRRTAGRVYRTNVRPNWLPGGDRFWYRSEFARGKHEFVLVDAYKKSRDRAFDHNKLAEQLAVKAGRTVMVYALAFRALTFSPGATTFSFSAFGKTWLWDRRTNRLAFRVATSISFRVSVARKLSTSCIGWLQ